MRNILKKIIASVSAAAIMLWPVLSLAQSWVPSEEIPNVPPSTVVYDPEIAPPIYVQNVLTAMDGVFDDLGLDKGQLKQQIKSANVSRFKKQQPQVMLDFEPSDPTPGQKVTAVATPLNFTNTSESLYFTWYLHQEGHGGRPDDWRERAAKIIANNDFEWDRNGDNQPDPEVYDSDTDSDGYNAIMGGDDQKGKNNSCWIHDTKTGQEFLMDSCSHLFPDDIGDGSFGLTEERRWHTNPHDPGTDDVMRKDEAIIAGLGQGKFSWIYQPGDEIGVAVEGISIESTQDYDSTYKIMWAYPSNKCDIHGTYSTVDEWGRVTWHTTMTASGDIHNCMVHNMVDPTEGGGRAEKLLVDLDFSPNFPINDPSGERGDQLNIHSTVSNAKNSGYLKYEWMVYGGDDPNGDKWIQLLKSALPDASPTSGMGIHTLQFRLASQVFTDYNYLKVKLRVTENVTPGITRDGYSFVVIPLNSSTDQISAYGVNVDPATLALSLNTSANRCSQSLEQTICPVLKNEIIGLSFPTTGNLTDIYWTINGEMLGPLNENCSSGECQTAPSGGYFGGQSTNIAYLPILEDPGALYNVTLDATNQRTGQKVSFSKIFKVVEPEIRIISADELAVKPLLLGHYIDLNGKSWPDRSEDTFEGLAGSTILLRPIFNSYPQPPQNIIWYVDGLPITQSNAADFDYAIDANGILTLSPKLFGEIYNVGIETNYFQPNDIKKALSKYWNVPMSEYYEKQVTDAIDINITGSISNTRGASAPYKSKALAAVYTGLPSYSLFLLRVMLTGLLILFSSRFIFSLFSRVNEDKI